MKLYTFEQEDDNLYKDPVVLKGPLYLSQTNFDDIDAASKKYVDDKFSTDLNAGEVNGVIPVGRLMAFSGDASNTAGSNVFSLKDNITAGNYTKVVVNTRGLVVSGNALDASDIPNLNWSKVINKPTTLVGYGITDAIKLTGDTISTKLSYKGSSANALNPATKGMLDGSLSTVGGEILPVGSIFETAIEDTPAKYLRANGGVVSRATYAALYSVIGDRFSGKMVIGSGQPWEQQYLFNTTDPGNLTWTIEAGLPEILGWPKALVTKNRVYLLGGYNGSNHVSTVYTAPINEDGTLGTWSTGTSLPGVLSWSQIVVTKNRVYLLGGQSDTTVYTAPINEDGTLGTWTTGTSLPGALGYSQAVVTKNRVYLLGGYSVYIGYVSTVYTAPINEDGTLGTWTTGTDLPVSLGVSQFIVTKNRVYILGGYSVYTAPINEDGTLGTWTTGTSLPGSLNYSRSVVTKNRVYLLGGYNGSNHVSTVYTAPINEDGTLGTWTTGTSLPGPLHRSAVLITKNRVYLLGGANNSGYTSTVYTAPFTGGKNDYSEFYTGDIFTNLDPTKFTLPDLTSEEASNTKFYIRYEN